MFFRHNRILHTAFIFGLAFVFALLAWAVRGDIPAAHAQTETPTPTETATATPTATPNPDCELDVKKEAASTVPEGGQITYTITVANDAENDDGECTDLDVTDVVPNHTDCVSASITEDAGLNFDEDEITESCEDNDTVEWSTSSNLDAGEEVVLKMVVELTSAADEDDVISNTACATSSSDVGGDCDTERVTVGAPVTATPTTAPTATAAPTVPPPPPPPVLPTVPPPPLPTLVAPPTGTGPSTGTVLFWAAAAGLGALGCLLLLSGGVVWSRRTR